MIFFQTHLVYLTFYAEGTLCTRLWLNMFEHAFEQKKKRVKQMDLKKSY